MPIPPTTPIVTARPKDREVAAGPEVTGEDEADVLDRDEQVRAPAVVAILLEPFENAVGRVAGIDPDREVEQREDAEDEERSREVEDRPAGRLYRAPGDERSHRDEEAEQPGVALGVLPGRRVEVDLLVTVIM
jgi:hypothetical protein